MEPLPPAPTMETPAEPDAPEAPGSPPTAGWYQLDPEIPYRELRLGDTPGMTRALWIGGGLAAGMIALTGLAMWFAWLLGGSAMPVSN